MLYGLYEGLLKIWEELSLPGAKESEEDSAATLWLQILQLPRLQPRRRHETAAPRTEE